MLRSEESMDDNEACTPTLPLKMTKTSLSLQDIQALSRLFYAGAFNECLSFAIDLMTAATSSSTDLPGKHIKVLLLIYLRSVYELGVPIEEHWNRAIAVYQSSLVAPEILVVGTFLHLKHGKREQAQTLLETWFKASQKDALLADVTTDPRMESHYERLVELYTLHILCHKYEQTEQQSDGWKQALEFLSSPKIQIRDGFRKTLEDQIVTLFRPAVGPVNPLVLPVSGGNEAPLTKQKLPSVETKKGVPPPTCTPKPTPPPESNSWLVQTWSWLKHTTLKTRILSSLSLGSLLLLIFLFILQRRTLQKRRLVKGNRGPR